MLSNVGFLAGAVPILDILDCGAEAAASLDEDDLVSAYMIAYFSALDSELHVAGHEGYERANSVGARLYTTTRRGADRAMRRVEREVRDGSLTLGALADVVA